MSPPAVSVVICTYNRAELLRNTLQTLLELEVPPDVEWELILVDNNSTDETKPIVEAFATRLSRPVQYVVERTPGKSYALNTGVLASRGEILAFIDDDVLVDSGWLKALWRAFEETDCTGVGGRIRAGWTTAKPPWYSATGPYRLISAITEY